MPPFLVGLIAKVIESSAGTLVSAILTPIIGLVKQHLEGKITIEQLHAEVTKAVIGSAADVEKAHAAALTSTFASFAGAAEKSVMLQRAWCTVIYSELAVLLWHQVGIPAYVHFGGIGHYPSSGTTVDWAYALLGGCLGLGPVVLRAGPAAMSATVAAFKSALPR